MQRKNKKIWEKLSKDDINQCPLGKYTGPIKIIRTEEKSVKAIKKLKNEQVIGFDTETRPAFQKGESYSPALIQLAGKNCVYIFQLKLLELTSLLLELLEDKNIIKAGVSIDFDIAELRKVSEFEPGGFIDLGDEAKQIGIKNHGLRGLAAVLLGFRISKGAKTSNWEKEKLSSSQIIYAATDAWVGRELYLKLKELSIP